MPSRLVAAGRILGVGSGSVAFALLLAAMLGVGMSYGRLEPDSYFIVALMSVFAAAAAATAWQRKAGLLLLLALVSFLPFGLYLLGVPHWLKWVGVADLGCLVAAVLMLSGSLAARRRPGRS